jgi:hypothetical protein
MAGSQDGRIAAFISRRLGWLALDLPSSLEFGVVDPHPMQNYAHPTGQSDRCPFRPTPTNDLLRPGAQPGLLLGAVDHHRGSLIERGPHV